MDTELNIRVELTLKASWTSVSVGEAIAFFTIALLFETSHEMVLERRK